MAEAWVARIPSAIVSQWVWCWPLKNSVAEPFWRDFHMPYIAIPPIVSTSAARSSGRKLAVMSDEVGQNSVRTWNAGAPLAEQGQRTVGDASVAVAGRN